MNENQFKSEEYKNPGLSKYIDPVFYGRRLVRRIEYIYGVKVEYIGYFPVKLSSKFYNCIAICHYFTLKKHFKVKSVFVFLSHFPGLSYIEVEHDKVLIGLSDQERLICDFDVQQITIEYGKTIKNKS